MIPDTLPALLAQRINNAAPALLDRGRPMSYRELADESARFAQGLRKLGIRKGDRVALWLPNVAAWLAAIFGCARLGAIAVAVNTRFRSHELADILQRSEARVLLFWPEFKGMDFSGILATCDPQALARLETVIAYGESGTPAPAVIVGKPALPYAVFISGEPLQADDAAPGSGCAVFTTSGTTRAPKFVLHDQRTVLSHAFGVVDGFVLDERARLHRGPDAGRRQTAPARRSAWRGRTVSHRSRSSRCSMVHLSTRRP